MTPPGPFQFDPKEGNKIKRARDVLLLLADWLEQGEHLVAEADLIRKVVDELMWRDTPAKPIARAQASKITSQIVRDVLVVFAEDPTRSNRSIGRPFRIDGGRVSEIIHGHRTEQYPEGTPEWKMSRNPNAGRGQKPTATIQSP